MISKTLLQFYGEFVQQTQNNLFVSVMHRFEAESKS